MAHSEDLKAVVLKAQGSQLMALGRTQCSNTAEHTFEPNIFYRGLGQAATSLTLVELLMLIVKLNAD